MIWQCPKCKSPLNTLVKSLVCREGHQYDRAKQGYTHLLLANQKNSRDPGDNDEMISARRQFLRAGYYQGLVNSLSQLLNELGKGLTLADLGCGEGYYLESLLQSHVCRGETSSHFYGIDISKPAVKKAASSAKQLLLSNEELKQNVLDYAVASSSNLPIQSASCDAVLTIFAPCDFSEIKRILKPEAKFIRVAPGPRHLYQIRNVIYDEVSLHEPPNIESGFILEQEVAVKFEISLDSAEAITQLLAMTPFSWHGKGDAKSDLIKVGVLNVEVDFLIQVCSVVSSEDENQQRGASRA